MQRYTLRFTINVLLFVILFGAAPQAKAPAQDHTAHKVTSAASIKWSPLFPNVEIALISGNPMQEGAPFVMRIRHRDGGKIPPHWHPIDEHLTVLQGTIIAGMGEKIEGGIQQELQAGDYLVLPKNMAHFMIAKGESVIQIHGVGPFKTVWVNPEDAPGAKAKSN